MISRDRQLLVRLGRLNARLTKINRGIAETMNLLMHNLDDDMLPASGLRQLADHFEGFAVEFRTLAAELHATADANEAAASTPPDSPAGHAAAGDPRATGNGP